MLVACFRRVDRHTNKAIAAVRPANLSVDGSGMQGSRLVCTINGENRLSLGVLPHTTVPGPKGCASVIVLVPDVATRTPTERTSYRSEICAPVCVSMPGANTLNNAGIPTINPSYGPIVNVPTRTSASSFGLPTNTPICSPSSAVAFRNTPPSQILTRLVGPLIGINVPCAVEQAMKPRKSVEKSNRFFKLDLRCCDVARPTLSWRTYRGLA